MAHVAYVETPDGIYSYCDKKATQAYERMYNYSKMGHKRIGYSVFSACDEHIGSLKETIDRISVCNITDSLKD